MTGMARDWIGVGLTYPTSLTVFSKGLMSFRSSKDFCFWACCLLLSLFPFCLGLPSIKIFSYAICSPYSFYKTCRFYFWWLVFYIFCFKLVWFTFISDSSLTFSLSFFSLSVSLLPWHNPSKNDDRLFCTEVDWRTSKSSESLWLFYRSILYFGFF